MQELGIMERFADPALFQSLTLGEKVSGGLVTTLMGMGTTFVILAMLWFVIAMTSKIIKRSEKRAADTATASTAEVSQLATTAAGDQSVVKAGDDELVAVLMAAIAASSGAEYVNKLRISKISRIAGSRPAWNMAGSADTIDSRKI